MKSKLIFTITFFIIVLVEIVADLKQYFNLVYVFKPLLLISVLAYTRFTGDERVASGHAFFITGLWFALLGDIFLMVRSQDLFVPGLASFLIMQATYTYAFNLDRSDKISPVKASLLLLPFLIFAGVFFLVLYPYLPGTLKVAVGIYACSIAMMSWMSFIRKGYVSTQSFRLVFFGALIFMVSDSLIAIDRFIQPVPYNTIWVMSTYAVAQYLIMIGYLKTR